MARFEAGLLFIVIPVLLVIGLIALVRLGIKRRRQADLARRAPDLLRFEGLNPLVLEHLVKQREALKNAEDIMRKLLADPAVLIPSEYADPIERWIKDNPKEIS
ncbi:MAG: hypothetical protein U0491_02565 [Candidatus Saccharimonadales bacterium]